MQEPSVVHHTFVIERSFSKPPEQVFRALSEPALRRRWFADGDTHETLEFVMDFRVGGEERLRYRLGPMTPLPGVEAKNDAVYQDIVPGRRVVTASTMTVGARCISASLVTMELLASETGTDLICTHQGAFFEGSDGPQMREMGWRTLFERLSAELTGGES